MKTKWCTGCKRDLPVDEFSMMKASKDGLQYRCKECVKAYDEANKDKRKAHYEANKDKRKAHYEANKDKRKARMKAYREANKDKIKAYNKKLINSPSKNKTFFKGINTPDDLPEWNDKGEITVICYHCKERFTPVHKQVMPRYEALKGHMAGECHFYCSKQCKKDCDVFGFNPSSIDPRSKLYDHEYDPRELQGQWANAVKKRDGHQCQGCDNEESLPLHAHHIEALANTYDAWLIDNGITLCEECHSRAHSSEGCTIADIKSQRAEACMV